MAEEHERILSIYRRRLEHEGFKTSRRAPFPDYRPDIYARRNAREVLVEVEICATVHGVHTFGQLAFMDKYCRSNLRVGVLVVPRKCAAAARFLLESTFANRRLSVVGI